MARVKICGINSPAAMDAAVAVRAEWIGFVFVAGSPRQVSPAQAESLSARHSGGPLRVGLFVDPTEQQIEDALDAVPLDVLQLYADAARAAHLREIFGIAVWRAIGVAAAGDLPHAAETVDGYVLEGRARPQDLLPGGNGQQFDHGLLRGWNAPLPWLLGGGLTAGNVGAAIAASGADAVDVSSGVERERGLKDAGLIAAFVTAARGGQMAG